MYDHLSLLQFYSEWGADESLLSSCVNHFENKKPIPTLLDLKKQQAFHEGSQKTDQHPVFYAHNLQEIKQVILAFTNCLLKDTATHSVLPAGNPEASIFIIGDVPNADEDRTGQVFHGMADFWLHQMLGNIDITLNDCFRMPLIPWRPPGGRQVSKNELDLCLPFLHKIIALYQPKRILTIGQLTARTLLQTQSTFNQLKGKWHDYTCSETRKTIPLFPLYHFSQINMNAKIRQATWHDLLKIRTSIEKTVIDQ